MRGSEVLAGIGGAESRYQKLISYAGGDWTDGNCYMDLWVQLLQRLGLDPHPSLAPALGVDFEGDQWTFCKPSHYSLWRLYGIVIEELQIYRSPLGHFSTQLSLGRIPIVEVDSYFLPDATVAYHTSHSKTTIALIGISTDGVRYLHNSEAAALQAEDLQNIFRTHGSDAAICLPPYVEIAKVGALHHLSRDELVDTSLALAALHVKRRPTDNPIDRFEQHFDEYFPSLYKDPTGFGDYAFGSLRQLGVASAYGALYLRWLGRLSGYDLIESALACEALSFEAKRLLLKGARAARRGCAVDAREVFGRMREAWCAADRYLRHILT